VEHVIDKVNLREKLRGFSETWTPKIVGELNGQHVKLVKLEGEFVWHHHEHEDELFLVISGALVIHLRDRSVRLEPGEFAIVPRGVEHKPEALPMASVMLFEPVSTLNTGNVRNLRTVDRPDRL
jgi:mannose-6-phosphate isomerase-like protein (cupin superfamily)